jgi:hypothetical protein
MENVTSIKRLRYKPLVLNRKHAKYTGILLVHTLYSTACKQKILKEMKLPGTKYKLKHVVRKKKLPDSVKN